MFNLIIGLVIWAFVIIIAFAIAGFILNLIWIAFILAIMGISNLCQYLYKRLFVREV